MENSFICNANNIKDFYDSFEQFIKSKIKHELLHIRTLYNYINKDITNISKYKTDCSDIISNIKFINHKQVIKTINDMLYLFSEQEMDARKNELAGYIETIPDDDMIYIYEH